MEIKAAAEREVKRIKEVMPTVTALKQEGTGLISFAKDYAADSGFFLDNKKYVEAFEAAIIAWAYIDIGLKLKLLSVPTAHLKHFTAGSKTGKVKHNIFNFQS